jgi:hypothetical protein
MSDNKSNRHYFEIIQEICNIPGHHKVWELRTTAILGTAHILWKMLIQNNKTSAGTKEVSTRECIDRLAPTVYPLGTWLISGI